MFELSELKKEFLSYQGHLLALGGPGCGKTTIALIKARDSIIHVRLKSEQKILFLSFARSTISRVEQQLAGLGFEKKIKESVEINTYHGFTWTILKAHGYLLNGIKPLKLLPPHDAASKLADIVNNVDRENEKLRLFYEEGFLHFDLFSRLSNELLTKCEQLANIYRDTYPIIILDEFQDTDLHEWALIKTLGKTSTLIALADIEQRIYEFRGASPLRIKEFHDSFSPKEFDFGNENHRSNGTDILQFGNDLLTDSVKTKNYSNVKCIYYQSYNDAGYIQLKSCLFSSMRKLSDLYPNEWSIAILVPSKNLMLDVSKFLGSKQTFTNGGSMPAIEHDISIDPESPALAGILIARLLEQGGSSLEIEHSFYYGLYEYIRGRKGESIVNKNDLQLAEALLKYIDTGNIRGKNRQLLVTEIQRISIECSKLRFTGDPGYDWSSIIKILNDSKCSLIKDVSDDAKLLKLLHKSSILRSGLSEIWRESETYYGATLLLKNALLQEHFIVTSKNWTGINLMTMHKAKGKEFDEVVVFEGLFRGRILKDNADANDILQARLKLRVAVTRARENVTILSPEQKKCLLISSQ